MYLPVLQDFEYLDRINYFRPLKATLFLIYLPAKRYHLTYRYNPVLDSSKYHRVIQVGKA